MLYCPFENLTLLHRLGRTGSLSLTMLYCPFENLTLLHRLGRTGSFSLRNLTLAQRSMTGDIEINDREHRDHRQGTKRSKTGDIAVKDR